MKRYEKSKPLISLHVPKTGGTSFGNVIRQWFGNKFCVHRLDGKLNVMPPKYKLEGGICIHGHFNPITKTGVMDYYPEVDQFVMVLREPFDQHVSNYFFEKGQGENRFREGRRVPIPEPDIETYLKQRKSWIKYFMGFDFTLENYQEILDKYFVYIGITEDLQTSINVLASKLGFEPIPLKNLNTSVHDEEVRPEKREEHKRKYPLEYALYEYALQHYKE